MSVGWVPFHVRGFISLMQRELGLCRACEDITPFSRVCAFTYTILCRLIGRLVVVVSEFVVEVAV